MKVSVILGHQKLGSFNHAIAETVNNTLKLKGHEVIFHDLYQERFDPILIHDEIADESVLPPHVRHHCDEIVEAGGIVVIHPNWWGTPPAILKGWIDRVLRAGLGYKFGPAGSIPLFTDKTVQIFTTSNTPRDVEIKVYGDPLESFWKTIVFGLCGSKMFNRINFESVILSTPEMRAEWLETVAKTIRENF